jgi:hypothetical protein
MKLQGYRLALSNKSVLFVLPIAFLVLLLAIPLLLAFMAIKLTGLKTQQKKAWNSTISRTNEKLNEVVETTARRV